MPTSSEPGEFRRAAEESTFTGPDLARRALDGTSAPAAHTDEPHAHFLGWSEAARIVVVALAAAAVWFRFWEPFPGFSLIGTAALVVGGWPIFREAIGNLAARRMTMELSMTIAIVAAAAISEFFTALVITLFVLVAEVLEAMTVARGRRAIRDLIEFLPRHVVVRQDGVIRQVDADALAPGACVLVAPGGLIPVDGEVTAGHSFVDETRITGESLPAEKAPGDAVWAGSINQAGALELRAARIGRDTSFGRIIEAVEAAEHSRAPVERLADRMAGYLVYFALGAAAVTYAITRDMHATISVVIVAGACGIAAGTPLAILGAIGRAARTGTIVKGGLYLELLGKVDTVVLDKTGTLTFGTPEVVGLVPVPGVSAGELLEVAASAELRSEHPLGRTIVTHARREGCTVAEPDGFEYVPGRGVSAHVGTAVCRVGNRALMREHGIDVPPDLPDHPGGSELLVARDGRLLGAIAVSDTVRPESHQAVERIHRMGVRTILMTGDAQRVADAVGGRLGIGEVLGGLMPEDKLARVEKLVAEGRKVLVVGDGVNDAPALARAHVGVAMGSGTAVARESADVVLAGNDLEKFVGVLVLARHTRGIIWQNFAGTILVDTAGVLLAAVGVLNPLLAAFIHVASELTFILNSARLLPGPQRVGGDGTVSEPLRADSGPV